MLVKQNYLHVISSSSLSGMFTLTRDSFSTSFVPKVSYKLSKNVVGQLSYKTGINSRMKTAIEYDDKNYHVAVACQLSPENTYIMCEFNKNFMNNDIVLRTSVKYGYLGFLFNYGIAKKISEFSHLGASILVGNKIGVLLSIR
jgi:hypothetical protein